MSELWNDMLDVLKDISSYLEKQDATQERAKIDEPPKAQETAKPIKGGETPSGFAPAKGIAKEYIPVPTKGTSVDEEDTEEEKKKKEEEEEKEEELEEEEDEKSSDVEELKSLLKDIRNALAKQSNTEQIIKSELKKTLPSVVKAETDKMLRKMGFTPTRPDVMKLGIDEPLDVKKSEDITKSSDGEEKQLEEVNKIVEDMSKKSFRELGAMREKAGLFRAF